MKTQSGRSMIEMLGVLAIIGVLSVGGLMGYQRAMRNNRANNLIYYVNTCFTMQRSRGDSITEDPVGGAIGNACLGLTGETVVPPGLTADAQCGRATGGHTVCSFNVDANLVDVVAGKLGFNGNIANFCLNSDIAQGNNGWQQIAACPNP